MNRIISMSFFPRSKNLTRQHRGISSDQSLFEKNDERDPRLFCRRISRKPCIGPRAVIGSCGPGFTRDLHTINRSHSRHTVIRSRLKASENSTLSVTQSAAVRRIANVVMRPAFPAE